MSTVPPPPPPPPPTGAAVAAAPTVLTATASAEVVDRLAALAAQGRDLTVRITDAPTRTTALADSDAGPLSLRGSALKSALQAAIQGNAATSAANAARLTTLQGALLDLRLMSVAGEQAQVRVVAVNGVALPGTQAVPAQAAALLPAPQAPLGSATAAAITLSPAAASGVPGATGGQVSGLPALVVQGGGAMTPTTAPLTAGTPPVLPLPVGTMLSVRLAAVTPPITPQAPPSGPLPSGPLPSGPLPSGPLPSGALPSGAIPSGSLPSAPPPSGPPSPGPGPGSGPTLPTPAASTPGNLATATPPPQPSPPPAPGLGTLLLHGVVQSKGAGGQPVIATAAGSVVVQAPLNLAVGTAVTLEATLRPPQSAATAPTTAAAASGSAPAGQPGSLPAMTAEALTLLTRSNAEAAIRFAAQLPGPEGRLLATAMVVAQAVRNNDSRAWPGADTLRDLRAAGPRGAALAQQMAAGLREAATTQARDAAGQDWRILSMPFAAGGTVDRIQMITRRLGGDDEDGENDERRGGGQRFLINFKLSHFGSMQIDGLYGKAKRRLDIILRTRAPLPDPVRRDLLGLYAEAANALGLKGGLSFQTDHAFAGPPPGDPPPPPLRDGLEA